MSENKTLCWACRNAVPDKSGNGCSWSRRFIPVSGWTAIEDEKMDIDDKCYYVLECPKYVRG